jgi:hypothetical protein
MCDAEAQEFKKKFEESQEINGGLITMPATVVRYRVLLVS